MAKKNFKRVVSHTDAKYLPKGIKLAKKTAVLDNKDVFERDVDSRYDGRADIDRSAKDLNKSHKNTLKKHNIDAATPISGDDIAKMGENRIDSDRTWNRENVDITIQGLHTPPNRASYSTRRPGV
jgi:hypothetical protein